MGEVSKKAVDPFTILYDQLRDVLRLVKNPPSELPTVFISQLDAVKNSKTLSADERYENLLVLLLHLRFSLAVAEKKQQDLTGDKGDLLKNINKIVHGLLKKYGSDEKFSFFKKHRNAIRSDELDISEILLPEEDYFFLLTSKLKALLEPSPRSSPTFSKVAGSSPIAPQVLKQSMPYRRYLHQLIENLAEAKVDLPIKVEALMVLLVHIGVTLLQAKEQRVNLFGDEGEIAKGVELIIDEAFDSWTEDELAEFRNDYFAYIFSRKMDINRLIADVSAASDVLVTSTSSSSTKSNSSGK